MKKLISRSDTIKNKIYADIIESMKTKDKETLETLRMVKGAIQLEEIKLKKELTDEEVIVILGRQIKTRKESIVEFEKGNREDLVSKTEKEIEILNQYMPVQMGEEEILSLIMETIETVNPKGTSDMGAVMGNLTPKVKGKADMGLVSKLVKEKLSNL